MLDGFLNVEDAYYYISFVALAFLAEAMVILWLGKKIHDLFTPYSLDDQLTTQDNKALAVSYVGYLVAQAVIVWGVMQGPATDWVHDLIQVGLWSLIGIVLLNLAGKINDRFLLRRFSSTKEIIEDQNTGVGAVQGGAYIGTAFLIEAIVAGEQQSWQDSLVAVLVFFVLGQLTFLVFALIYARIIGFDLHDQMEKDNAAAGLSFGLTTVAVGVLLSNTLQHSMSIPAFFAWFLNGITLIIITRFLVDKLILPNHKLDDEIANDQNWGVALIEGGSAVMVAFLLNASFA